MTQAQISRFTHATGGIMPAQLLLLIAGILAVIYLLWTAWMAYSQLRSWKSGQGDFYDVIFITTRAAVVALLVGYLIH